MFPPHTHAHTPTGSSARRMTSRRDKEMQQPAFSATTVNPYEAFPRCPLRTDRRTFPRRTSAPSVSKGTNGSRASLGSKTKLPVPQPPPLHLEGNTSQMAPWGEHSTAFVVVYNSIIVRRSATLPNTQVQHFLTPVVLVPRRKKQKNKKNEEHSRAGAAVITHTHTPREKRFPPSYHMEHPCYSTTHPIHRVLTLRGNAQHSTIVPTAGGANTQHHQQQQKLIT